MLYGLDIHYRDHTLHSIWVYFVGEHILRDFLPDIHGNLNWYVYNDIERDKSDYSDKLLKEARQKEVLEKNKITALKTKLNLTDEEWELMTNG